MLGLVVLADREVSLGCVEREHSIAGRALLLDFVSALLFGFVVVIFERVWNWLLLVAVAVPLDV